MGLPVYVAQAGDGVARYGSGDDVRAGRPGQGEAEVRGVGDDRLAPPSLEETDDGLDLGQHAARLEMPLDDVLARLGERHPVDLLLPRRPVAEADLLYGRRDDEQVRAQLPREEAR